MSPTVSLAVALATDLAAITLLAYAVYFRRHHRRDLLFGYVALNVGVLAATILLSEAPADVGFGLGLFGILSIIRLRSDQITQAEVAYYFVALTLGIVNGLRSAPGWFGPLVSAALVAVVWVVDHPRLGAGTRRQLVTLDAAFVDDVEVREALVRLLGAEVLSFAVLELDLVRDVTVVDVRFRIRDGRPHRPSIARRMGRAA